MDNRSNRWFAPAAAAAAACAGPALAGTVTVVASRDNTLYQDAQGDRSNGRGSYFFAGSTDDSEDRRGLIRFDLTGAVPAGSTVNTVTLTLHMSRTQTGNQMVSLHRALADWGEGASNAAGEEGMGAPAAPGDATWLHRFFPNQMWTTAGGDFAAAASATQTVNTIGTYTWTGPGLAADAQMWLDTPAMNFGWLVRGNEASSETTKRFDSRENANASFRPMLTIDFTPGPPDCLPDWNNDGAVNSDDYFAFLTDFFMGNADFNQSGETNSDDYFAFLSAFFEGCP